MIVDAFKQSATFAVPIRYSSCFMFILFVLAIAVVNIHIYLAENLTVTPLVGFRKENCGGTEQHWKLFPEQALDFVQLHQCFHGGKGIDVGVQYIFLDLKQQGIIQLDKTQLVLILFLQF